MISKLFQEFIIFYSKKLITEEKQAVYQYKRKKVIYFYSEHCRTTDVCFS